MLQGRRHALAELSDNLTSIDRATALLLNRFLPANLTSLEVRKFQILTHTEAGMVVADLHVHTTNSDGTLTLDTLPTAADRADLEAVAITDHDRLHPDLDTPVTTMSGLTVIHGIELRVDTGDIRVDLLGYGVRRTDELTDLCAHLQENRVKRARKIVSRVEDRIDVDLDVKFEPGVSRGHIAHAIDESEHKFDYRDAFRHLIGEGCPCYVSRDIPTFEEGCRHLADACDVVSLAHPLRSQPGSDQPDPEVTKSALALLKDLDAVELYYPYSRPVDTSPVQTAADEHDLLVTGGSDAHDEKLGVAGLDRKAYERFRENLT